MSKPRRPEFFPKMKYRARIRHRIPGGFKIRLHSADFSECRASFIRNNGSKNQPKAYPKNWPGLSATTWILDEAMRRPKC